VDPATWFDRLRAALGADAGAADPGQVTDAERDALLDLARVAAHTSERWTAPISTFLAGVAYAGTQPADREAALRALVGALEPEAATPDVTDRS
jgi:hypothetical protein